MPNLTDEQFEIIVSKYHTLLITVAYSYLRDDLLIEDVVRETFIKLYGSNKLFENESHIKNWLVRVTINECLDVLKHKSKELLIDSNYIDGLPNTLQPDSPRNEDIYNCICSLKDSYKTIIFLYYYDNLSLKEIANILNISESNASSRLVRARNQLKTIILNRRNSNE